MDFFNIKLLGFKKGGKGIYGFVEERGGGGESGYQTRYLRLKREQ